VTGGARWLVLVGAFGCGCAGANARSEQPHPTDTGAGAETANATDPIVCRKEDVSGYRMPKRVCRHQSEIDADRTDAQKTLQQTQTAGAAESDEVNSMH
jgi:hypothetical protein